MSRAQRRARVLERVREDADALLVTGLTNVAYLTGFRGSNAQLLLGADPVLLTDGRYTTQAAEQSDVAAEIYASGSSYGGILANALAGRGLDRLAIEAAHVSVAERDRLGAELSAAELVHTSGIVERVRAVKDDTEVEAIRRAQRVAEAAVAENIRQWPVGTETQAALDLEWSIRTGGAEGLAFGVIVATGSHAALPHARPRDVRAERGVLLIDIGARVDGYCSDMTRTWLDDSCSPTLRSAFKAVLRALEAGCAAVRPGATGADVDAAARSVLVDEGFGDQFAHGTGHAVGLDVHEWPRLGLRSEDVLEAGMVVTVEPGVYVPGSGGIRIEDLLLVTESGSENLTALPRELRL